MPSSWYKTVMLARGIDVGSYKPIKTTPGPVPTLGEIASREPHWLWLHCASSNQTCWHKAAMPLAPLIIRWGPDASSDALRRCARCSKCGTKGAHMIAPSVDVKAVTTWGLFPVERRAFVCWPE